MNKNIKVNKILCGSKLVVPVPAGLYYIGDPCHALNEKSFDKLFLNNVFSMEEGNKDVFDMAVVTALGLMAAWHTEMGDGWYEVAEDNNAISDVPVDSGTLSLISSRLINKPSCHWGHMTYFTKDTTLVVEHHIATVNNISIDATKEAYYSRMKKSS